MALNWREKMKTRRPFKSGLTWSFVFNSVTRLCKSARFCWLIWSVSCFNWVASKLGRLEPSPLTEFCGLTWIWRLTSVFCSLFSDFWFGTSPDPNSEVEFLPCVDPDFGSESIGLFSSSFIAAILLLSGFGCKLITTSLSLFSFKLVWATLVVSWGESNSLFKWNLAFESQAFSSTGKNLCTSHSDSRQQFQQSCDPFSCAPYIPGCQRILDRSVSNLFHPLREDG